MEFENHFEEQAEGLEEENLEAVEPTPEDIGMLKAALSNPELDPDERSKIEAIIEQYGEEII